MFINIGVSIGLLPTKGIPLPLISFGGSNLMLMFVLIALVQKIKIEANARSKKDNTFTIFLFFFVINFDCSLKEINRVIPVKKMKPTPNSRTFCGSMILYLLNYALEVLFRKDAGAVNVSSI